MATSYEAVKLLGQVIAMFYTGSTPVTVLVGALLLVISGGWMAWSVLRPFRLGGWRAPSPTEGAVTNPVFREVATRRVGNVKRASEVE